MIAEDIPTVTPCKETMLSVKQSTKTNLLQKVDTREAEGLKQPT